MLDHLIRIPIDQTITPPITSLIIIVFVYVFKIVFLPVGHTLVCFNQFLVFKRKTIVYASRSWVIVTTVCLVYQRHDLIMLTVVSRWA